MGIEIRLFEPCMWEKFCGFVRTAYNNPSHFLLDREYFDWWYRDSPANWEEGYRPLVILDGKKVIGLSAQVPNTFRIKDNTYHGAWYCSGMIDPEYRGRGLGKQLYIEATHYFEVGGVISYNAGALALFRAAGFETFAERMMHRAVFLLQPESVAKHLPNLNQKLVEMLKDRFTRSNKSFESGIVAPVRELSPELATLWDKVRYRYTITTERTLQYIKWRYLDHPRGQYHIITHMQGDKPEAVGVMRFESEEPTKVCRIVDVWGTQDNIKPLLNKMLAYAHQAGAIFADFFCTNWPDREAFEKVGFYILNETMAYHIPYLFSPLELRHDYHEPIGLWSKDPEVIKGLDYEDIYFVRGDSDRDRPQ